MMLTHIDKKGNAIIVDISKKNPTKRKAIASGKIKVSNNVIKTIKDNNNKKGDIFTVAKIAGILASKNTSGLIPLCHPLKIENITIEFIIDDKNNLIEVLSSVTCFEKTGVEMEALCATSVSLLTIYDMCKAIDKSMMILDIKLLKKIGGKNNLKKSK